MPVELHGYRYSVYAWIARFALREKGVGYRWSEVNPFAERLPAEYLAINPFGRVPTLVNGGFVLYETRAITEYVDEAFEGPNLQPTAAEGRARMSQIISIADCYAYWPLVRQVFGEGVMAGRLGQEPDASDYRQGLKAAPRVLEALDRLVGNAGFLVGDRLTLADVHWAPMIAYFTLAPDGPALLKDHQGLNTWWSTMATRKALLETQPALPEPALRG